MMVRPLQCMIIGAQKAGTSSLKYYIVQHSQMHLHPRRQEILFFIDESEYKLGYAAVYPRYFTEAEDADVVIAGKNVGILYEPEAIARLQRHNPHMQIVVTLRDPVERAYSSYWFARRLGWEPLDSFEAALEAPVERFRDDPVRRRNCAYLEGGLYERHLTTVLQHFRQEQVAIFLTEDLRSDPLGVCRSIYERLGIDSTFRPNVERQHNTATQSRFTALAYLLYRVSARRLPAGVRRLLPVEGLHRVKATVKRLNEQAFRPPPMLPETRVRLLDYFHQPNERLSAMLERDLSQWNTCNT